MTWIERCQQLKSSCVLLLMCSFYSYNNWYMYINSGYELRFIYQLLLEKMSPLSFPQTLSCGGTDTRLERVAEIEPDSSLYMIQLGLTMQQAQTLGLWNLSQSQCASCTIFE